MIQTIVMTVHPAEMKPENIDRQRYLNHIGFLHNSHHAGFTHGDLNSSNVVLRDDGIVVLIDWKFSAWYPDYWKYCCAMLGANATTEFAEWVNVFLDAHPGELGWMLHLRTMFFLAYF